MRSGDPGPFASTEPIQIRELQLDQPGAGELTIKIHAAGLCHSDLSVINGDRPRPVPIVLGHEAAGEVTEIHCTHDPATRGGSTPDGRKVQGTIHWVCGKNAVAAEFRLYDRLFTVADPDNDTDGKSYRDYLNPDSVQIMMGFVEPAAADCTAETNYQFERQGYFAADRHDHTPGTPVYNRTVGLRDTWTTK